MPRTLSLSWTPDAASFTVMVFILQTLISDSTSCSSVSSGRHQAWGCGTDKARAGLQCAVRGKKRFKDRPRPLKHDSSPTIKIQSLDTLPYDWYFTASVTVFYICGACSNIARVVIVDRR